MLVLVVLAVGVSACQPTEARTGRVLPTLELLGSSEPLLHSRNNSIALASEERVCVIESYEFRVQCGNQDWSARLEFGSEGQGPGEFLRPSWLLRGPRGSMGVYDIGQGRLTVYTEAGELSYTAVLPPFFVALGPFDRTILGTYTPMRPESPLSATILAEISLPDGETLRETALLHPHDVGLQSEAEWGLWRGARGPAGELVFGTGKSEIVRYDASGELTDNFSTPAYVAELPSARDVDWYVAGMTGAFGRPPESVIRRFKANPKPYSIVGRGRIFDDTGRLWVGTQRGRDEHSYFDLYSGVEFLGRVKIRDRVLGFDLMGSTLAVLVERSETDLEGIPIRAIDWYRMGEPED
jgi:hypothetical protein